MRRINYTLGGAISASLASVADHGGSFWVGAIAVVFGLAIAVSAVLDDEREAKK